jgi:asparagine synthase (glutamine-hydrolysing)
MFDGIRKLQPGAVLIVENGRIVERRYWELRKNGMPSLGADEAAEAVYAGLERSVRLRLQSDVPVGTLLSGGLDSSAVLALMTKISGAPVPAFSVGYSSDGDDGFSEFQYARRVASHCRSDYHEVVVTPQMFLDFLPKAVWFQDEPIGEPASVPLYYVCKLARDAGITVLLSGEGSDELFAGYNRHLGESVSRYYGRLPKVVQNAAGRLLALMPQKGILRKGHRAMITRNFWDRYQSWHTVFSPELKGELLAPDPGVIDTFADIFGTRQPPDENLDDLDKILWLDTQSWLPDDLLMKKDRMAMATAIEARVPFLDHEFAQMAFSIPSSLKVKKLCGKYILKRSMERLLPKEIIYRKKAGFPTPIGKWMREDLREPVMEMLCGAGPSGHGFFDQGVVRRLVDEHVTGRHNHERLLFPILNFNLWYEAFFTGSVHYEDARALRA